MPDRAVGLGACGAQVRWLDVGEEDLVDRFAACVAAAGDVDVLMPRP